MGRKRLSFDTVQHKDKFAVIGQKGKRGSRQRARQRSSGVEERKNTLLVELQRSQRANTFLDRRFGEGDEGLTPDERALARYQKERNKAFAGGQSGELDTGGLSLLPDFGEGSPDQDYTGAASLGLEQDSGSDAEEDLFSKAQRSNKSLHQYDAPFQKDKNAAPRSKKEVMEEIIAKSKAHKAQKARQREDDLDAVLAADAEWNQLMQNGGLEDLTKSRGMKRLKSHDAMDSAFDKDTEDLRTQKRAKAGDTPKRRLDDTDTVNPADLRRDQAELQSVAAEAGSSLPSGGFALRRARKAMQENDQLQDALEEKEEEEDEDNEDSCIGQGFEEQLHKAVGSHPLQQSFQKTMNQVLSKMMQRSSDGNSGNAVEAIGGPDTPGSLSHKGVTEADTGSAVESYEAYSRQVSGIAGAELQAALLLMKARSKQSAKDNPAKLQVLFACLAQHFAHLAGEEHVSVRELNILAREISSLAPEVPLFAATTALARLSQLRERLAQGLEGGKKGKAEKSSSCWPTRRQLLLLKLWTVAFPASDHRHPVLAPEMLLIASYLSLCPLTCVSDLRAGLYLCSLAADLATASGRLVPEISLFLARVCETVGTIGMPSEAAEQLYQAAFEAIGSAAELYAQTPCLPELFAPVCKQLHKLHDQELPQHLEAKRKEVLESLEARFGESAATRLPLKKIRAIEEVKLFNPRFDEEFSSWKDRDPDREKAAARKLRRAVVKERRGAMRELRKDAAFLSEESRKAKEGSRTELRNKLQQNNSWLQKLNADLKSGGQGGMWKKKRRK